MEKLPEGLSISNLARQWECAGSTIRRMILTGKLQAFRVGNRYRVTAESISAWLAKSNQAVTA